jgi:hypothetical protein
MYGQLERDLMEGKFDVAVLYYSAKCSRAKRRVLRLPKKPIDRYWHNWSRSVDKEIKFEIRRERGLFYAEIPQPVGLVDVAAFRGSGTTDCSRPGRVRVTGPGRHVTRKCWDAFRSAGCLSRMETTKFYLHIFRSSGNVANKPRLTGSENL